VLTSVLSLAGVLGDTEVPTLLREIGFALIGLQIGLTAGVSLLDGYLATTPGGLFAVLPIAYGIGANTTFVLAVQGLRLLGMVLAAPAVVRLLVRSGARPLAG
jgi:uncharacterized protein